MSNDKCSVEIDTKAHYLKESNKEEVDYHQKSCEILNDRDQLHEIIMDGNEALTDAIYELMNTFKDPTECCIKIYSAIYNAALEKVVT